MINIVKHTNLNAGVPCNINSLGGAQGCRPGVPPRGAAWDSPPGFQMNVDIATSINITIAIAINIIINYRFKAVKIAINLAIQITIHTNININININISS